MIHKDFAHLYIASISHPGMSGKNNEDNHAVSFHQISPTDKTPSVLAVLADGIGGHHAGEVAAKIATDVITKIVSGSDGARPLKILESAIIQAGQEINRQSNANKQQHGMGSTCACAWVIGDRLYTASVGDSRIYLVQNRSIQQLTTDHTWVQEAIDHGIIEREEARDHPQAHVIRRYLGSQRNVEPDFRLRLGSEKSDQDAIGNQGLKLKPGEIVLLCSDGLSDLVDDNEILEILQNHPSQQAVEALVKLANTRGGHDNITIVTMEMPDSYTQTKKLYSAKVKDYKSKLRWYVLLIISILIIVIAALGSMLYHNGILRLTNPPLLSVTTENPELIPFTPQGTEVIPLTLTPSPIPTETPILDTYTPWPTHTFPPEP